jgi:flagellar basal-body rod protein FlgB
VSENIANANISGYRAQDVQSFASYLEDTGRSQGLQEAEVVEAKVLSGATMTGNNVNLEEQLVEANSASGQFQMAASLYRKAHEMVYAVAGRR